VPAESKSKHSGPGNSRPSVLAAIYTSHPYALSVPALAVPRLAVNLVTARVSGGLEGDRPQGFVPRRHSLFLTAAGAAVNRLKESPSRHLGIYFHPEVFDGANGGTLSRSELPCWLNESIAGIGPLVDQLVRELQSPEILSAEAADSVARLLPIGLARRFRGASRTASALTPKAIERLRDSIAGRLGERILVADLAQQAGLSPNHFSASFTEYTGRPPPQVRSGHQDRAGRGTAESIDTDHRPDAHGCGFSSQQHLSNAFRRQSDTTPSRYRLRARSPAFR
jgi:AraC family transcriptional regulator